MHSEKEIIKAIRKLHLELDGKAEEARHFGNGDYGSAVGAQRDILRRVEEILGIPTQERRKIRGETGYWPVRTQRHRH